ncbi:hypothetical protein T12_16889 [Trichinella patagoniensis]|uniref:Uncharacterized protein n=1 Tax=Trichinella patagoniensis TaxID=990121 RepID=A0A0V0ZP85_9BILA|nr:hypothetical protein T12_16889 [Trichinella patagoniensis]
MLSKTIVLFGFQFVKLYDCFIQRPKRYNNKNEIMHMTVGTSKYFNVTNTVRTFCSFGKVNKAKSKMEIRLRINADKVIITFVFMITGKLCIFTTLKTDFFH